MFNLMILETALGKSAGTPRQRVMYGARWKHTLGSLAIVLLWLLPLAGCGGGNMQASPPPNQPTTIAFASQRALDGSAAANSNNTANLWTVKGDGTGATPLTRLTALGASVGPAVWSRDGGRIAFASGRALDGSDAANTKDTSNIWVMKSDGTGVTPLTKLTAGGADSFLPVWSPDGSKIAFLATRALDGSDAPGSPNFWVINADGTGASPLTKLTAVTIITGPVWSPDGAKIAFGSFRALDGSDAANANSTENIWVMKSDSTGVTPLTKLTAAGANSYLPVWSPDGAQIAFLATRALDGSDATNTNRTLNIWVMKSDGTGVTPLTKLTAAADTFSPVWSADSAKIAFASTRALDGSDAANTNRTFNIWAMKADGSAIAPLTKLTAANAWSTSPAWSADGSKIAFESRRAMDGSDAADTNSVFNIWVMSPDGSDPVPLTKLIVANSDSLDPKWKP